MSRWTSGLRSHVVRRPGLTWLIATTLAVLILTLLGASSQLRLPFVMLFVCTVPGCLVIDVGTPHDLVAKIVIGIGGSLSFNLLVVSIALLGSPAWLVPVLGTFAIALAAWLRSRSRTNRARSEEVDEPGGPG